MLANIHEYFNCCHKFYFHRSNLSKILHVAFLLPVSIDINIFLFFTNLINIKKRHNHKSQPNVFTPAGRQSKTLLTIDERGWKIARNGVFD